MYESPPEPLEGVVDLDRDPQLRAIDLRTHDHGALEVVDISVVMPCLNEEGSVGICVAKAWEGIRATGLRGEVVVADNGSTDESVAVATAAGARVVHQPLRGYGNAYRRGFAAARGRVIVMGDSDDSYDFRAIPELIEPLHRGYDYVLGSRFGGTIERGAMTWSHRYIGNPVLTAVLNLLFKLKVSDAHSGLRAFTRGSLDRMSLRCEGMEFASEIVIKAARAGLRVAEVPIVYHPRIGESKLNSLSDGWRHLRFLLLLSPKYLFMMPGLAMLIAGTLGEVALLPAAGSSGVLTAKILLALVVLLGSEVTAFGIFARSYARNVGFEVRSRFSEWVEREFTVERGCAWGLLLITVGLVLLVGRLILGWGPIGEGGLATSAVITGLLATVLGATVCFDAFFLNLFQVRLHAAEPVESELAALETSPAAAAGEALAS